MSGKSASADTLLTEHFRYTPLALIDDIINTVNAIVYRALTAVESGLLNTPPSTLGFGPPASKAKDEEALREASARAGAEIEDGVHQLETLLEATVDKNFDKFEIYALRNLLSVPEELVKWIRLSHYENLTLPLSADSPTPESIQALRQKLHASQSLSLALEAEHAATDSILSTLRSITTTAPQMIIKPDPSSVPLSSRVPDPSSTSAPLSFLTSSTAYSNPSSSTPLTTSAQFTASQLPALRTLVAELRPKLQSLSALADTEGAVGDRMDWEAAREERRTYVDGETRRAVKGELGAADDDAGAGLGVGRRQVEVEALESIVGAGGSEAKRSKE